MTGSRFFLRNENRTNRWVKAERYIEDESIELEITGSQYFISAVLHIIGNGLMGNGSGILKYRLN
jgi:hypothetical protein